jgi:hypothetical protein
MGFPEVTIIIGAVFLVIGFIGGLLKYKLKESEISIPAIKPIIRILFSIVGISFIVFGFWQAQYSLTKNLPGVTPTTISVIATGTSSPISRIIPITTSTSISATENKTPTSTPIPIPSATAESPFTGSWQGIDPYDGSITTLSLVQSGDELDGNYTDSFSAKIKPPGYYGKGVGTILSSTTAHIIFILSRWDGLTAKYEFDLTLSNHNETLKVNNCNWNNEIDNLGCPMVLLK